MAAPTAESPIPPSSPNCRWQRQYQRKPAMLKSGGQLELTGVITIELASFHPSTATSIGFDLALEWPFP